MDTTQARALAAQLLTRWDDDTAAALDADGWNVEVLLEQARCTHPATRVHAETA